MSCDGLYICLDCYERFDQLFNERGLKPPICPCGSDNVMNYEAYQENELLNEQEKWAESWNGW